VTLLDQIWERYEALDLFVTPKKLYVHLKTDKIS
jgi:hypothetical protein